MINIHEGLDVFWEDYKEAPIYIYGAGHCGDWIGEYMNRCNIDFAGYIDNSSLSGEMLNGKPCYRIDLLKEFKGKDVRIIISPGAYKSIRYDLLEAEHRYGVNCGCITPISSSLKTKDNPTGYDINKFLGYFRRKFLKESLPMIISNDTTSGDITRMFAGSMDEHVPYIGFTNDDFLKICDEPCKYFATTPKDFFVTAAPRLKQGKHICAMAEDITVHFFKCISKEDAVKEWEIYCKSFESKRHFFILSDHNGCISKEQQERFDSISNNHLTIHRRDRVFSLNGFEGPHLCMDGYYLSKTDLVIETGFDIIGWVNSLYE